jgi:hypothetical protein
MNVEFGIVEVWSAAIIAVMQVLKSTIFDRIPGFPEWKFRNLILNFTTFVFCFLVYLVYCYYALSGITGTLLLAGLPTIFVCFSLSTGEYEVIKSVVDTFTKKK